MALPRSKALPLHGTRSAVHLQGPPTTPDAGGKMEGRVGACSPNCWLAYPGPRVVGSAPMLQLLGSAAGILTGDCQPAGRKTPRRAGEQAAMPVIQQLSHHAQKGHSSSNAGRKSNKNTQVTSTQYGFSLVTQTREPCSSQPGHQRAPLSASP